MTLEQSVIMTNADQVLHTIIDSIDEAIKIGFDNETEMVEIIQQHLLEAHRIIHNLNYNV